MRTLPIVWICDTLISVLSVLVSKDADYTPSSPCAPNRLIARETFFLWTCFEQPFAKLTISFAYTTRACLTHLALSRPTARAPCRYSRKIFATSEVRLCPTDETDQPKQDVKNQLKNRETNYYGSNQGNFNWPKDLKSSINTGRQYKPPLTKRAMQHDWYRSS